MDRSESQPASGQGGVDRIEAEWESGAAALPARASVLQPLDAVAEAGNISRPIERHSQNTGSGDRRMGRVVNAHAQRRRGTCTGIRI
ncbi:hypothetical protein GCM10007884_08520 [Methylobacterium brachythecii]|uniref:Uncharacterized protein n=1 Tax=Methylobacterium brachythecii TaxID=1176177 RepID=A0ABQ6CXP7_9HYPH|nr:hypothetical protein GCM10007884_08520 [Methylobacterium brachythecii]